MKIFASGALVLMLFCSGCTFFPKNPTSDSISENTAAPDQTESGNPEFAPVRLDDDLTVSFEVTPEGQEMFLEKNGKKTSIVKCAPLSPADGCHLTREVQLSPQKNYLLYQVFPWEIEYIGIYDLENEETVYENFQTAAFGFTADEKYFYACASNELMGDYSVKILDGQNFNSLADLNDGTNLFLHYCAYDATGNDLFFAVADVPPGVNIDGSGSFQKFQYNFETKELKQIYVL